MYVYKIDHDGLAVYVKTDRPLNGADIGLFRALVANAGDTAGKLNAGAIRSAVSRFSAASAIDMSITKQPFVAVIDV